MTQAPENPLRATSFAENLARRYVSNVDDSRSLIGAFAGLVAARDPRLAADCLIALEEALSQRVSPGKRERSA